MEIKEYKNNLFTILGICWQDLNDDRNFIHQFKNLKCFVIKGIQSDHLDNIYLNDLSTIMLEFDKFPKFEKKIHGIKVIVGK